MTSNETEQSGQSTQKKEEPEEANKEEIKQPTSHIEANDDPV